MIKEATYLGKIINVDSNVIEANILEVIPSAAPIIKGRLYRIGQIGTLVKIPICNITIYGMVSSVSNTPGKVNEQNQEPDYGNKYLQIQLIGERIGNMILLKV